MGKPWQVVNNAVNDEANPDSASDKIKAEEKNALLFNFAIEGKISGHGKLFKIHFSTDVDIGATTGVGFLIEPCIYQGLPAVTYQFIFEGIVTCQH